MLRKISAFLAGAVAATAPACAFEYACVTAEPQKTGWPLTAEERAYVLKPEHERRPRTEAGKRFPELWPVVPSAGNWGGTGWLDTHARLVERARTARGPIDVLLLGDSITEQWGPAWAKHFPTLRTVNSGIGGDKTENVLWRLDHGAADGLEPRVVVVLVGNNNMFYTPETGVAAAARGIETVVRRVRAQFVAAEVICVSIFPAHTPGFEFYEDIRKTNAALDALQLDRDPKVHRLDLTRDLLNADGTLRPGVFAADNIHLTQEAGYALFAEKLRPLLERFLGKR